MAGGSKDVAMSSGIRRLCLFFGMNSIVEVILIIVRCRVGRGGVNMDVPEGDKARRCNGWKAKLT